MYVQTLSDNKKGANLKESHYICFKTLKFIKTSKNEKIFLANGLQLNTFL